MWGSLVVVWSSADAGPVDPTADVAQVFLDRGVLGAVVLVLGLFAWWSIRRERSRADARDAEFQALLKNYTDEVVPALVLGQDATNRTAAQAERTNELLTKVDSTLAVVLDELRRRDGDRRPSR